MIKSLLSFSIHHRYLIALLTAAVASVGLYMLGNLPIDAVPDITNNQVQINTMSPALSVNEVEKQVTFPIETALAGISGLESTRSISRNAFSQVTAVFSDKVDIYFARQQVSERLAEAKESLPDGVEPSMGAISTGLGEIYMWTVEYTKEGRKKQHDGEAGWQSDGSYLTAEGQRLANDLERASYLRTVQDWMIRPQIKGVEGVAGVDAIGGYVQQYHVQPNPEKLVALGLSFSDIIESIEANNHSIGAGYIEQGGESYVVRADGRISAPNELGDIVVTTRKGIPVYLRDLATIGIGRELRTGSASENGEEVVVGTALMLIGANSRTVADAVDMKMKEVNKSLPAGIHAKAVLNRTKLVDATISTVQENLTVGALLVIGVLFWLLGNIRAAIITALVIPVSMLMTAIGMVKGGISGNLMSLGALDFGLIVDGSIIITENCLKRLAERQHHVGRTLNLTERLHEVMAAAQEMVRPTVFGQLIIILVYVPMLTFTGVEGKMFSPMAMTVIIALVSALILSLTFVPAMIAIFVKNRISEKESPVIEKVRVRYEMWLGRAMLQPMRVAGLAVAGFILAAIMFMFMGREFIPTLDEKDIAMHAMRIPSTGITTSQEMQFAVERAISKNPEVAFVFSKTGTAEMAADPMPPNVSDTFIILKPQDEWPDSISKAELIKKLEKSVAKVPANNYEFTQPIQMRFNELISGVRSDVAVKLYGDDFDALSSTAVKIAQVLQKTEGAADVKVEQTEGLPMLEVKLRKEAIARYGLNVSDVLDVLAIAVGGREAGLIFEGDKRFDIVVRLPDELRQDIQVLESLPILLPSDGEEHDRPEYVPLKELADLETTEGVNQISRENGKRRIVVQANVRGRDIGSFVQEAQTAIESSVKLPAGYWTEWGGQFENLKAASKRLALVVPACFFMIFLLLFTALNSVKQALLVFSGIPLAVIGGVFTLFLFGMPFSVSAAVGFIALSGISVLNGLVMITSINQHVLAGLPPEQAVREGALSKLRPMLMAAIVPSLGYVPMAVSTGAGAEVQRPLAMVVIGGLLVATALTMVVLPALYRKFNLDKEVRE
ncbi:MAG: CusA/CzcA family heavy metal efflux RND transporter [Alphaproteobacteria bacterium]|nr:CusA/CzcA family heavy metal efflux RND transporter [Alphaproteobacteria bacterium]